MSESGLSVDWKAFGKAGLTMERDNLSSQLGRASTNSIWKSLKGQSSHYVGTR